MELTLIAKDEYTIADAAKGNDRFSELGEAIGETNAEDYFYLANLFEDIAKNGLNDQRYSLHIKPLGNGIFEFKRGKQIRVYFFYGEKDHCLIVCTCSLVKKDQKADQRVLRKAKKLKNQYERSVKAGEGYITEE